MGMGGVLNTRRGRAIGVEGEERVRDGGVRVRNFRTLRQRLTTVRK